MNVKSWSGPALVLLHPSLKYWWHKVEEPIPTPTQTGSVGTGKYSITRKGRQIGWSLVSGQIGQWEDLERG